MTGDVSQWDISKQETLPRCTISPLSNMSGLLLLLTEGCFEYTVETC